MTLSAYSKTAACHGCDCDNSDSCDKPPLSAEIVAKTATVAVANPQSMKTESIEASLEAIEKSSQEIKIRLFRHESDIRIFTGSMNGLC